MIEDEELKAIEVESSRAIEIDAFVPRADIDERFFESPYYIAPSEAVGAEAFARHPRGDARQEHGGAGAGGAFHRERVLMLQPWENGMLGMTCAIPMNCAIPPSISTTSRT